MNGIITLQKVKMPDTFRLNAANPIVDRPNGTSVIPGLRDLHTHVALSPIFLGCGSIDISDCKNVPIVIAKLKDQGNDGRNIIVATGLDTNAIQHLSRTDLDEVSRNIPILIFDPSFHGGFLNTKSLQRIEDASRPYKETIRGDLTEDGHWTELYLYPCLGLIAESLGEETITKAILGWVINQLKKGVVEVHEMDIGDVFSLRCLINVYEIWKGRLGDLPFPVTRLYGIPSVVAALENDPTLRSKVENYFGSIGIKLYADGAFGSHTACLKRPYADLDSTGRLVDTPELLKSTLRMLRRTGIHSMAIHAIGDAGIEHAYELARFVHAERGISSRVEHFELSGDKRILETARRLVSSGILLGVSVQPTFNPDITNYYGRLDVRANLIDPIARIVGSNIPLNFGTDEIAAGYPIPSMLKAVNEAVVHPLPEQRISLELALRIAATRSFYPFDPELAGDSVVIVNSSMLEAIRRTSIGTEALEREVVQVLYHGYDVQDLARLLSP